MGRALLVLETSADRQKAVTWINKAPVGTRVEFKASKRSLPQNDLMWALLTDIAQQIEHGGRKYDATEWKCIFLHAFGREITFLPSLDNRTFLPIEMSSSDLSKDEMTDFIEFIMKEGTERGVTFHIPKDTNTNPGDESLPSAGTDDAPTPAESTAEDRSPPDFGMEPAGQMTQPAGSPSDYQNWLLNVARMLWAATNFNGDISVLKAQKLAAMDDFPKPDGCPAIIIGKAESVYGYCKQVTDGAMEKPDGLAIVAGVVGVDQDEIRKRAV